MNEPKITFLSQMSMSDFIDMSPRGEYTTPWVLPEQHSTIDEQYELDCQIHQLSIDELLMEK